VRGINKILVGLFCIAVSASASQGRTDGTIPISKYNTNQNTIELTAFDAKRNGNIVEVKWSTLSETNSDFFIIQRSVDGKEFQDVMQALAAGNSSSEQEYYTDDYAPFDGISYYRVIQVDNHGNHLFSKNTAVELPPIEHIAVYPNPIIGQINVQLKIETGDEVAIVVRDVFGKEYYSTVVISSTENEIFVIDQERNIPPGMYVVVATSNDYVYEKRIVVQ